MGCGFTKKFKITIESICFRKGQIITNSHPLEHLFNFISNYPDRLKKYVDISQIKKLTVIFLM